MYICTRRLKLNAVTEIKQLQDYEAINKFPEPVNSK